MDKPKPPPKPNPSTDGVWDDGMPLSRFEKVLLAVMIVAVIVVNVWFIVRLISE